MDRERCAKAQNAKLEATPPPFFVPFICFPLRSKFLDKPSETSFVVISLNNSKSKQVLFGIVFAYS